MTVAAPYLLTGRKLEQFRGGLGVPGRPGGAGPLGDHRGCWAAHCTAHTGDVDSDLRGRCRKRMTMPVTRL